MCILKMKKFLKKLKELYPSMNVKLIQNRKLRQFEFDTILFRNSFFDICSQITFQDFIPPSPLFQNNVKIEFKFLKYNYVIEDFANQFSTIELSYDFSSHIAILNSGQTVQYFDDDNFNNIVKLQCFFIKLLESQIEDLKRYVVTSMHITYFKMH